MRSRYTAFALGDAAHLRATWHPSTAPERLDLDAATRWEGLGIISTTGGSHDDRRGTVEFRARWRDADTGRRGVLHEVSRFRLAAGRWYYLDGEVSELETPEE
jgi:SEC-C motif-containing protein